MRSVRPVAADTLGYYRLVALDQSMGLIRWVAREQLIAPIAAERDLHVLAHEIAEQIGRHVLTGDDAARGLQEGTAVAAIHPHTGIADELSGARQQPMHARQMMRQEDIVGIEKRHEFAARLVKAAIARRATAGIGLVEIVDAAVGKLIHDRTRIVGRAIIHHHYLEILEGLGAHGLDRLPQGLGAVEDGNHDAEERRGHGVILRHRGLASR